MMLPEFLLEAGKRFDREGEMARLNPQNGEHKALVVVPTEEVRLKEK